MTLETLPAPLQKCVETVREQFVARHLNISSAVIEECALGILNAALEAGVAREDTAHELPDGSWDNYHVPVANEFPVILIRTGDT